MPQPAASESSGLWLDSLFDNAPVGLAFWDVQLRYQRVNDRLAEINGIPPGDHLGKTVAELLPNIPDTVSRHLRVAVEDGVASLDELVVGETPAAPGVLRSWSVSYFPVRDPQGTIIGVGAVCEEITELREARAEEAEAQQALGRERAILRQVLSQSPIGMVVIWGQEHRYIFANEAGLALLPTRKEIVGLTVGEAFPELADLARKTLGKVMASGEITEMPGLEVPFAEGGSRWYDVSLVPISDGGEVGGVLATYLDVTRHRVERQALEQDLLEERTIAETLQRALLPRHLAEIPGAQVAARYRAAGERHRAGGDFYDVFAEADGRTIAVVGDVCGKGPEAAAATAMARFTLQGEATHEHSPARALRGLNDTITRRSRGPGADSPRFCSIAYASFLPTAQGLEATLALAGHPPPILVRAGGTARTVGTAGDLVGIWAASHHVDTSFQLARGDSLVFYTDGVLESAAPGSVLHPEDLAAFLAARVALPAEELAGEVEKLVASQSAVPRDDYAIVVVRVDA